ncbi:MAG: HupE/UreJ family protein [Parvibaculaceae bacterium]
MSKITMKPILFAALALLPSPAWAHTGHGDASGLVHGMMHPLGGLDHILAMVLVGILAVQLGSRAIWILPASFLTVMGLSGLLGMSGIELPFVEWGIILSVVVLGGLVASGFAAPVPVAAALVGLFAIFHGYAHGAEMPGTADGVAYGMGFIAATALLHAAGIGIGALLVRLTRSRGLALARWVGSAASLTGLALLAGLA